MLNASVVYLGGRGTKDHTVEDDRHEDDGSISRHENLARACIFYV